MNQITVGWAQEVDWGKGSEYWLDWDNEEGQMPISVSLARKINKAQMGQYVYGIIDGKRYEIIIGPRYR